MRLIRLMLLLLLFVSSASIQAQITIGGNVYGGGNQGEVKGNTKVTVKAGELNSVYAGARMGNVGGKTFVNVDGENATGDILVTNVYGGNDITGTIGQSGEATTVPTELTEVLEIPEKTDEELAELGKTREEYIADYKKEHSDKNVVDYSWKTFVRTSRSKLEEEKEKYTIVIGSLYGGGNGEYVYTNTATTDKTKSYDVYQIPKKDGDAPVASITIDKEQNNLPILGKTYLEVNGGCIGHVYGGGNNATVTENTTISINNSSDDLEKSIDDYYLRNKDIHSIGSKEDIYAYLISKVSLNTFQSDITNFGFNHARIFGGNNKAEMHIRPTWNLQKGIIRDLYSGGNQGDMTSPDGLLLEIDPITENKNKLEINNVYGGCRMADVKPTNSEGIYTPCANLEGYKFPAELSARTLVRGGHINNIYGGNDITGKVYGGNAIGIYTTVYGDVYGGGNGAYAYTNQSAFANSSIFGDFYYKPGATTMATLDSLNAHRPNAEQVSIRLLGSGPGPGMTIIKGSVFLGGNCASLATVKEKPLVELKIGSYVIADKVFLGNNGEKMIDSKILSYYAGDVDATGDIVASGSGTDYSIGTDSNGFDLKTASHMAAYMNGAAMPLQPRVVFDDTDNGDPADYVDNSSYVGSFYCGGNVGSMIIPGKNTYSIDHELNIFEKFVGGCNNAYVPVITDDDGNALNAAYNGGVLGSAAEQTNYWDVADTKMKDRLEINLENLTITPLRWGEDQTQLIWNTNKWDDEVNDFIEVPNSPIDEDTRLLGGNVYGGCYSSGHVNGNVTININEDVLDREAVFGTGAGPNGNPASGIELEDQRDDVMAIALGVFGAGYGEDTEIWGSTTVNLNKGYAFQVFGGGELGVVGKKNGSGEYVYNPAYSSTVNLKGLNAGYSETTTGPALPETEYIYGGGNEGDVCGDTYVYLGNGRIYDAFGGASDADILGHTEVYIGKQPNGSGGYQDGFPWVRDIVYGGNDFGGTILGTGNFKDKVRVETGEGAFDVLGKVHNPDNKETPDVLKANTYVEYLQGRVDTIFGGSYGNYDYTLNMYKDEEGNSPKMPSQEASFVNIRPNKEVKAENQIIGIFGGGTGYPGNRDGDRSQNRSYVLIDIPDNLSNFRTTEIFGAGSYNGMGMNSAYDPVSQKTVDEYGDPVDDLDKLSTIIDLVRGKVGAAYGGSFMEGVTRRTMVNVPRGSTIDIGSIFGGAYGKDLLAPCDVYEAHVNYSSADAILNYNGSNELMKGAIYGGNNACRRTLYGFVDIDAPVWERHPTYGKTRATVYGAGCGPMTWSEYTEVNLNKKPEGVTGDYTGAEVFEVYGGAQNGEVLNAESAKSFMNKYLDGHDLPQYLQTIFDAKGYNTVSWSNEIWPACWTLGKGYYYPYTESGTFDVDTKFDNYSTNEATNLSNPLVRTEEMDDRDYTDPKNKATDRYKYNTNVLIHDGAYVANYAYGGGLGTSSMPGSGDCYGTTYIALLGGEVKKDIYAAGTTGAVLDNYESGAFIASSSAFIKGGMCRNVYGGGWEGNVGKHTGGLNAPYYDFVNNKALDIYGETHVVIGDLSDNTFTGGKPAITRNVYGGGEGGSVFGTTHLTINNGMIGYRWKDDTYVEELDDKAAGDNELDGSGNAFGGGYVLNSYVDNTDVKMFGGQIRGSLFGGGEVGPVGRGTIRYKGDYSTGVVNGNARIFKAGKTHVEMYNGHVLRNVFGGGRGKDNWEGDGTYSMDAAVVATLDHDCKGFIFGQTEVNIFGGEIGTNEGMARSFGNVFGGGDEGSVYSAYEKSDGTLGYGEKIGNRYDDDHEGYYFKKEDGAFVTEGTGAAIRNVFTEDCKVLVEPWLQVTKEGGINFDADGDNVAENYPKGSYIPTAYLNTLEAKGTDWPAAWGDVDVGTAAKERGVIIHNAVFAGGNVAYGSSSMSADEKTVFGNATASIHDVYNRDFITIGTGYTGGLYGDGNLTLVDGYRELNITNYGTDKNHLTDELTKAQYDLLPPREQAYYEVKYKCIATNGCTDQEGNTYKKNAILPRDELMALFTYEDGTSVRNNDSGELVESGGTAILTGATLEPNPAIWEENGVVSTYAGRIMNTIQRADFCGVFGSRMVMKGARDRVTNKEDKKNYTINRVREVSLNKMVSKNENDKTKYTSGEHAGEYKNPDAAEHGNYFGIYSNVNYFGALTSDVDFHTAVRTTKTEDAESKHVAADGKTFAEWKAANVTNKNRNNGNCHNQLALASGVYLELTTEKSTGTEVKDKDWGLITGVVELDLINVQTGIGGGYVYAKNEHGKRKEGHQNTTLTALNATAVSKFNWEYETADSQRERWETSGNFIHSSQTIIDDCYNESSRYLSTNFVKAHYWFISGSVYVYDQYITAHTGASNAFSEKVELPITIYAASNGKMTLMDVQPNLYAYYSSANTKLGPNNKVVINNIEYKLNDPITYWEWYKLPLAERKLFVDDTYIVKKDCRIGETDYLAGTVLLSSDYKSLSSNKTVKKLEKNDDDIYVVPKDEEGHDITLPFTDAFRSSNNLGHNTGYLLTYSVTNPDVWNPWYSVITGDSKTNKIQLVEYNALNAASEKDETGAITKKGQDYYYDGPTYTPTTTGLYGQKEYDVNDIIPKDVYDTYTGINPTYIPNYGLTEDDTNFKEDKKQATFVPAYVVTKECMYGSNQYYPGAPVSEGVGTSLGAANASPAYVCTSTIEIPGGEDIYVNELMTLSEKNTLITKYSSLEADFNKYIVPAYYCTSPGLYGGDVYEEGKNYRALGIWSSMTKAERENFTFNYDALDLLVDSTYGKSVSGVREKEGQKYQYDSADKTLAGALANKATYSLPTPIDYTATYNGGDGDIVATEPEKNYFETSSKQIPGGKVHVDEELTRKQYESLPNEQRHYSAITVKPEDVSDKNHTVYVVEKDFVHIETPYAAGTTIDVAVVNKLSVDEKLNLDTLIFKQADLDYDTKVVEGIEKKDYKETTFFYCREKYQVNEKGESNRTPTPVSITGAHGGIKQTTETVGESEVTYDWVEVGTIIKDGDYTNLPNKQKNFTIHGKSPMETSTLYVSRFSDINDLSQEKIITVIYKYDYEESDESGLHVTPVSERHVVNIHIKIESGEPTIPDIQEPDIVLPGTSVSMRTPVPIPGTYEVKGGGWELFDKASDADSHINGKPYTPSKDSLYWYQDGFLIAYYAKTQLGKTYSNAVPVHVANYHDLKGIMDDKTYHLHVDYDRNRLKRESKVYINDYSGDKDGLDLLKDFYDLSLLHTGTSDDGHVVTTDAETGLISSGSFEGHALLNTDATNGVKAGKNLQFFLRTDIEHEDDPAVANEWTPIAGGSDPCFNGTFHGDGHTISGLDNSLFGKLCGDVYNLGVTGSFTSAGVADEGDGYVESCWVKSSATTTDAVTKPYPVFGNPTDDKGYQVVNSYFWDENSGLYNTTTSNGLFTYAKSSKGEARAMTSKEFYNGTVAYDLNSFYLNKRYHDNNVPSDKSYKYKTLKADGTVDEEVSTGYYPAVSVNAQFCDAGYVENRFDDGDFRFAAGTIPTEVDDRYYTVTTEDPDTHIQTVTSHWAPIWPDDYLFFGQMLTYGHSDTEAHDDLPTAIVRDESNRLPENEQNNRVYRAPAYFGNSTMGVAHFNKNVFLAQNKKGDDATKAYPGMTAIDFRGHYYGANETYGSYGLGDATGLFYTPLLDDDGLLSIKNVDETKNLLVYAPAPGDNLKTHTVLTGYFVDPVYTDYYDNSDGYRLVRKSDMSIYGHLVQSNLIATNDHLLVDKEDFNCPISYDFQKSSKLTTATRMWYQRIPEETEYVTPVWTGSPAVRTTKGWQGVSIPFTAELVTTNEKGEITHFYSGSETSKNGTGSKIGHEYWLREFKDGGHVSASDSKVYEAKMNYPDATSTSKNYTNTFLWDYYYKKSDRKDANEDLYQTYYHTGHTYSGYPYLAGAKPYIIGLPGSTYYEFDLSGNFEAQNTKAKIDKLGQQIITFVSEEGAKINVSDTELSMTGTVTYDGYTFQANYANKELSDGYFVMNSDGNAYYQLSSAAATWNTTGSKYADAAAFAEGQTAASDSKLYSDADGTVEATWGDAETTYYTRTTVKTTLNDQNNVSTSQYAFRPYFVGPPSGSRAATRSIVFSRDEADETIKPMESHEANEPGTLIVNGGKHKIIVKSGLKVTTKVRIVNANGITLNTFDIEPGETIETRVNLSGVYMVQTVDGKFIKKIAIR